MKEQNHHTRRASCWRCLICTFILFYLTVSLSLLVFSFTQFSLHHVFLGMSMLDLFVLIWSYWLLCVSYKIKEKLHQSKVDWSDFQMVLWPNLMHRTLRTTITTSSILAAKASINSSSEENIQDVSWGTWLQMMLVRNMTKSLFFTGGCLFICDA